MFTLMGSVPRQIGDDQVRLQDLLVHRHVDIPGVLNLVCADALIPGGSDGQLDDVMVRLVQIEGLILLVGRVSLRTAITTKHFGMAVLPFAATGEPM